VLYRKFVHPELLKREEEIDLTLDKVKTQGYSALVNVGQQGLNFAVQSALTGQNKVMDHLMKKSLSMGDISQQQRGSQQVTYRPGTQQIPEEIDETDLGAHRGAPVYDQLQGGEKHDSEKEFMEPHPPSEPRQRGYNLRSHEYHGGDTGEVPHPQHYNHKEDDIQELPPVNAEPSRNFITSAGVSELSNRISKPPSKPRARSKSASRKKKLSAKPSTTVSATKNTKPKEMTNHKLKSHSNPHIQITSAT